MFDNIAPAYDRLNHTLSLSVDRIWRRRVVRIVGRLHPRRVLDMATGTGDLAVMMARSIPEEFPQPEEFLTILAAAGFRDCRARSQSFGIAQIYTAEKC